MENQQQTKNINILYAMLILSAVISFIPLGVAQIASLALGVGVLVAAYLIRSKDDENGLMANHMTYLIGTIWFTTGFILLAMVVAVYWVYTAGDHTIIQGMIDRQSAGAMVGEAEMQAALEDYIMANRPLLMLAGLVFVPSIVYFIYRVLKGLSRARKGYRIAKPRGWL